MDSYFDLLENTLQETGHADYPSLYFNVDESGFALDPKLNHLCGEKMPSLFPVDLRRRSLSSLVLVLVAK